MNTIISKIYTLIHQTDNLIDFEESVRILMYDVPPLTQQAFLIKRIIISPMVCPPIFH